MSETDNEPESVIIPSTGESIIDVANSYGATDDVIVVGVLNMALAATKTIVPKGYGPMEVADNPTRLSAFKLLAQMKGHLQEKTKQKQKKSPIPYKLIRDGN